MLSTTRTRRLQASQKEVGVRYLALGLFLDGCSPRRRWIFGSPRLLHCMWKLTFLALCALVVFCLKYTRMGSPRLVVKRSATWTLSRRTQELESLRPQSFKQNTHLSCFAGCSLLCARGRVKIRLRVSAAQWNQKTTPAPQAQVLHHRRRPGF